MTNNTKCKSDDRYVLNIWLKKRKPSGILQQVELVDDILIDVHSQLSDIFPRLELASSGCVELNSFEMITRLLRE